MCASLKCWCELLIVYVQASLLNWCYRSYMCMHLHASVLYLDLVDLFSHIFVRVPTYFHDGFTRDLMKIRCFVVAVRPYFISALRSHENGIFHRIHTFS